MPTKLHGDFTLLQALYLTMENKRNRFDYMNRDVIKSIEIQEVKSYTPDRLNHPLVKYIIKTRSWPQYGEYLSKTGKNPKQRKNRAYQRTVSHEYETILQFGTEGITLNTKQWKMRVGSGRKWLDRKPPQSQLASIYRENLNTWSKEKIRRHRSKKYPYLSVGDFLSKKYGINMDFSIRLAYVYRKHGHLYGYCFGSDQPPVERNPRQEFFLPKHAIRIIDALGRQGILEKE